MLTGLLENDLSFRKIVETLALCRKLIPRPENQGTNAQLRSDLERLALSAPHMLSDIGFERDDKACSREMVVWRRGTLRVIVFTTTHTASVSV